MSSIEVNCDFPSPLELKKNETIHPQLEELDNKKLLLLFLRKITQTKPFIEMMQLLLYQINYPPFWTLRVWGLDRVPVQSFSCFAGIFLCFTSGVFEVLEGDLFHDDFMMAFYSFGGVNDQSGVTSWAV